ncbi:peptidyl-prolyl cis-trans isomerase A (cyclophilin A) [Colwellia chukchiensis]|uniref:Peptidyl-prolyl cis-trans isomerase n=2 Tax=Colwellia chukchiensis TaxID=641665 RepID=A0A1H7IUI0_9GAMM|nr:peptidyl-prolyl cis-trans isomerase A (cyclophilin A) [Colwellia chukchiensis]
MKMLSFIFLLFSATLTAKEALIDPDNLFPQVKLETSMGTIIVELDRVRAPITVNNFLNYVVSGEYDNTIFHRIVPEFIVQGGGYSQDFVMKKVYSNIVNEAGNGLKNEVGTIAMAKESRPHSANRQFFFNLGDNRSLDPGRKWGYAVFGAIIEGQEVLEAMALVKTDYNEHMSWEDVPVEPVILIKASLLPAT